MLRLTLAILLATSAACSGSSSTPWPDKPLVKTTADIGPYKVSLLLPKGVGSYVDPNGVIWRDVSPRYAFFIKVFKDEHPASLAKAIEDQGLEGGQKVVIKNKLTDGYEVVVEEPDNKRYTVHVWRKRGERSISCGGILGRDIGNASMVDKSNKWLLKICRSMTIL